MKYAEKNAATSNTNIIKIVFLLIQIIYLKRSRLKIIFTIDKTIAKSNA